MTAAGIRRTASALGALVAIAVTMLVGGAPAQAHAVLVKTSPAKDAALSIPPTEVVLTFDEAPLQLGAVIKVTGPAGVVSLGSPRISGAELHQALSSSLAAGSYRVDWRAVSDDGHPVSGTYGFSLAHAAVGAASSAPPAAAGTDPAPVASSSPNRGPLIWAAIAVLALFAAFAFWRFPRNPKETA
jgi:hypothetical protein